MSFNNASKNGCPCIDCPDKGCGIRHDTCESYMVWKKRQDANKEAENRKRTNTMSEAQKKAIWRSKRYSRQTGAMAGRPKR